MKKKLLLLALSFFLLAEIPVWAGNGKNIVTAVLKSATVYRTGAELVHTATASLVSGNNDLIIDGLSNSVETNSIHIGGTGNVTILAVEFSTDYLRAATPSAVIKKWKDSVETVKKEIARVQVFIKTDNDLLGVLQANKEIGGTQAGLSVAELMKMMDYYKTRSLAIEEELLQYKEKEKELNELVTKLQSQIQEEESKNTTTGGKLLLRLLSPLPGRYTFTISYLTTKAYWNPSYDFRVKNINEPLQVVYKAKLEQTTGIDWKQVNLSLATAAPNRNHTAPVLKNWFLSYLNPSNQLENILSGRVSGARAMPEASTAQLSEVVIAGYGTSRNASVEQESPSPIYIVNGTVVSRQEFSKLDKRVIKNMEVLKDKRAAAIYGSRAAGGAVIITLKDGLDDYIVTNDNQLDIVFHLDVPYDVPGNGKEQAVTLKEFPVPVLYKYFSIPKLDKEAYLLAEIPDWEKLNLLPGEANIIFDGTYTGKTHIDPGSTEDTFNLTLGADKRVAITREKLKDYSSVKFLGSNKKQVFTYEITVKNNNKEKVEMLLKDQYPLSTNKDIEVELLESDDASIDKETGELSWKLELAPNATKKFRVSYSVKYPKGRSLNLE